MADMTREELLHLYPNYEWVDVIPNQPAPVGPGVVLRGSAAAGKQLALVVNPDAEEPLRDMARVMSVAASDYWAKMGARRYVDDDV